MITDKERLANTRNTMQRNLVLETVRSLASHPTAEEVYENVILRDRRISKATVYRNLALFRESGDIVSVGTVAGQERFDSDVRPHPHFICSCCHRVIDLDLTFSAAERYPDIERATGGKVSGECLSFTGLCENCLKTRVRPDDSNN